MTALAAAGYCSDSATVCGGALSNLPNGEKGAVQQPLDAHAGVAARAVPAPSPVKTLAVVARAIKVDVMRRRFAPIVLLQARGGRAEARDCIRPDFGAVAHVSYRSDLEFLACRFPNQ